MVECRPECAGAIRSDNSASSDQRPVPPASRRRWQHVEGSRSRSPGVGSLSAMYFADARQALQEALRVLRPEGKAVYLVWGSFDQPMFRDIIGIIFKFVTPPEDEAGALSPFRFAEPGSLSTALAGAGFIDVREEAATLPTRFPGDPQQWWRWLVDTAAPVQTCRSIDNSPAG